MVTLEEPGNAFGWTPMLGLEPDLLATPARAERCVSLEASGPPGSCLCPRFMNINDFEEIGPIAIGQISVAYVPWIRIFRST